MAKRSERRLRREAREKAAKAVVVPTVVVTQNGDDESHLYRKGTELLDEQQVRELEQDGFEVIVFRVICNRKPEPQDYAFVCLN